MHKAYFWPSKMGEVGWVQIWIKMGCYFYNPYSVFDELGQLDITPTFFQCIKKEKKKKKL